MAYFSNSSEGDVFVAQCAKCKYGQSSCPIAFAQSMYNYDAVNNKIATAILNILVEQNGTCKMWVMGQKDFEINPNQVEMFED